MTTCYVIRHGETEWNLAGREMGHLDSRLSAAGLSQSQAVAHRLRRLDVNLVYSSDLGRAVCTAELIANQCGVPLVLDQRLRERDLGVFQGLTREEMEQRYPVEFAAYTRNAFEYAIPGGESGRQRTSRSVDAMTSIAARHSGDRIVVVTHSGFLKGFFEYATGVEPGNPWRYKLHNASVSAFIYDERGWAVETWNDISHLEAAYSRNEK